MLIAFKKFEISAAVIIGITAGMFTSCELINPAEPVPAYIAIDSIHFSTTQGSSSNAIVDGWVYIDNNLQGGYELPFTVPIKETGTHTISIKPGIKVDGLNSLRSVNTLYTFYDTIVNLEAGKTTKLYPTSTYYSGVTVNIVDDFDGGATQFIKDPDSDTTMFVTSANAFEGPFSGGFALDDTHTRFSSVTINHFVLTKGVDNLIEMNYKSNNSFVVGMVRNYFGSTDRIEVLTILPSNNIWKKIYISLDDLVNTQNADYYNLYFYSQRDAHSNTAEVLLDNIKLVHN